MLVFIFSYAALRKSISSRKIIWTALSCWCFHSFLLKMWNYMLSSPFSFSHGLVRRHDSVCATSQFEGVLPAAVRTAHLWCFLGKRCSQPKLNLQHIQAASMRRSKQTAIYEAHIQRENFCFINKKQTNMMIHDYERLCIYSSNLQAGVCHCWLSEALYIEQYWVWGRTWSHWLLCRN